MSIQPAPFTPGRSAIYTLTLFAATALLVLYFSDSRSSPYANNGIGEGTNDNIVLRHNADALQPSFDASRELDFAVIGFPKTGTSFLLEVLGMHPEITMPPKEFCKIHHENGDKELMHWIKNQTAYHPPEQKYGIKCPTMIRVTNAIENLMKVSDQTRLVIGVRHPILWFQVSWVCDMSS